MARRIKTGRRAGADDRAMAAMWVDMYRLAQASPDGRHCLNPADERECQTFIHVTDLEPLLQALGDFARNGTFEFMDSFGIADMMMRHELKALRASGRAYQNAIAELAENTTYPVAP